jgi:hypothetical protein
LAYTGFRILEQLDREHKPIALRVALTDAGGNAVRAAQRAERACGDSRRGHE